MSIVTEMYEEGLKDGKNKALDELLDYMKSNFLHKVGTQFDNAINEMEKKINKIKEGK